MPLTHYEKELSELKQRLLTMGSRTEVAVTSAVEALIKRDPQLAQEVRDGDTAIDQLEVSIGEQSVRLLSQAPLAGDLRLVLVTMRASQNLERIADEATKIAKRARALSEQPPLQVEVDVSRMARQVLDMLKRVLDAYVRSDVDQANAIIRKDKDVDALYKQYSENLVSSMTEDPSSIRRALQYLTVIKRLERIADHAKNIAEEVVFMRDARDIRHAGKAVASEETSFEAADDSEPATSGGS